MAKVYDFVVIGGGIYGMSMARRLGPFGKTVVLEKDFVGYHASSRNSGVIHAGIYYKPGSLKADYCVRGNRMLTAYCQERGINFNNIGKIIAPGSDNEIDALEALAENAR
jgi:L-2-hydroxyglutarate oxidase